MKLSQKENYRTSGYTGGATTGTVLDKIPTGTRRIYMEGTFYGSITQNIFANRFTNLSVINFSRGGGHIFIQIVLIVVAHFLMYQILLRNIHSNQMILEQLIKLQTEQLKGIVSS